VRHIDKTSADKTSIGFDFQHLVFVQKLLLLSPGESAGMEMLDDIHVEKRNADGSLASLTLIQAKHSLNTGNLTERDPDLWKTLYNWYSSFPDLPEAREYSFQLLTNKSLNDQLLVHFLKNPAQNSTKVIERIVDINAELQAAEAQKSDKDAPNPIAKFAKTLASADRNVLLRIINGFEFHSDFNRVLDRIADQLDYLAVPQSLIESTRLLIIGTCTESKFLMTRSGEKIDISYEKFRVDMGINRILRSMRGDPVDLGRFHDLYISTQRWDLLSFQGSLFYNQLADLHIAPDEIIERGMEMVTAERFIESIEEILPLNTNERLETEAESQWRKLHVAKYRAAYVDDDAHRNIAVDCYDTTIGKELALNGEKLPTAMSSGKFIKLSNSGIIGWRKDWIERFKK